MYPHRTLVNLLYPPACLLCHGRLPARDELAMLTLPRNPLSDERRSWWRGSTPLESRDVDWHVTCEDCRQAMPRNGPPVCSQCGVGLPGAYDAIILCDVCRTTSWAFQIARAPWQYAGPIQEAIRQFKYHRRWRLGAQLADEMAHLASLVFPLDAVDLLVAVPPHWVKRRLKGFNPVDQLAAVVARALKKPYLPHALRRTRWTATQTRLRFEERFQNVHHAFVADPTRVDDRTVLLIDDVLTSGATADACAQALNTSGARAVFVLTAARTPFHE